MKILFIIIFIFSFSGVYSQDTLKIRHIDSLVSDIKGSTLPIQIDTLIQDIPQMGIKTTTYLTTIVHNNELIKFVNYVNSTITENGIPKQMTASNAFYYYHNSLIKVEEFVNEGDKKGVADWYYSEDKPLYYTLNSDKSEERAAFLLTLSKTMLKQIIK